MSVCKRAGYIIQSLWTPKLEASFQRVFVQTIALVSLGTYRCLADCSAKFCVPDISRPLVCH
jgi:hypothetical protein